MSNLLDAPNDLEEIYLEAIEGPALACTSSVSQPKAIFLGGQPGAGKSTMARSAIGFFGSDNFVTVDVDRMRPLHPDYLRMATNAATEIQAPSAVQPVCSRWADDLREASIKNRRNVLLDGTMRSHSQVRAAAIALKAAGYAIEVHALAVHEESSAVSLRQRYENEKRILGFGRHIPLDYHAAATEGLAETIRMIETEQLVDLLVLHNRAGEVVYENRLADGKWVRDPGGANTLRAVRSQSYTPDEKRNIARQWDDVLDKMSLRNAGAVETRDALTARARANAIAERVATGIEHEYDGRITHVDLLLGTVTQKIGRDPAAVVAHAASDLTRTPAAGEVVNIKYRHGIGHVSPRQIGVSVGR